MLQIRVVPAVLFGANCYVVWEDTEPSKKALVVDPGPGTAQGVQDVLGAEQLEVGAVLLTHGHIDHVWDAAQVAALEQVTSADAEATVIPVLIPQPDLGFLQDPAGMLGFSPQGFGLPAWEYPAGVVPIEDLSFGPVPGIMFRMIPAPGHSPGSAVFLMAGTGGDATPLALSGDVVFAGSVGRTDLPGGDEEEMRESLRTLAGAMDPATTLLPGHGEATTWGHELATNPYVKRAVRRG